MCVCVFVCVCVCVCMGYIYMSGKSLRDLEILRNERVVEPLSLRKIERSRIFAAQASAEYYFGTEKKGGGECGPLG